MPTATAITPARLTVAELSVHRAATWPWAGQATLWPRQLALAAAAFPATWGLVRLLYCQLLCACDLINIMGCLLIF